MLPQASWRSSSRMSEEAKTMPLEASPRPKRDVTGALVGIALLVITFRLAYGMFTVPTDRALGLQPNQPVQLEDAGQRLVGVLIRILLLIVMAGVGSAIATRGIKLYTDGGSRRSPDG
jgi:CDP-diglyceride synthetase